MVERIQTQNQLELIDLARNVQTILTNPYVRRVVRRGGEKGFGWGHEDYMFGATDGGRTFGGVSFYSEIPNLTGAIYGHSAESYPFRARGELFKAGFDPEQSHAKDLLAMRVVLGAGNMRELLLGKPNGYNELVPPPSDVYNRFAQRMRDLSAYVCRQAELHMPEAMGAVA